MAAISCFMRNTNVPVIQRKNATGSLHNCNSVVPEEQISPTESLGKLLTELTIAIRSTHASDRLSRIVNLLDKLTATLHPNNVSKFAFETYVALLPCLVQVRAYVRDSRNDVDFLKLLVAWLTVSSRLLVIFLGIDHPTARDNIQYIKSRLFEIESADEETSVRAIICSALISHNRDCDLIISVIHHLDSLAAATNSDPSVSYIETLISVVLVLPGLIRSTCVLSVSLLIQFYSNHAPLVDKLLLQNVLCAKLFFLITYRGALSDRKLQSELIIPTLECLTNIPLTSETRVCIAGFVHRLFLGNCNGRSNPSETTVLSPNRSVAIPTLSLRSDSTNQSVLSDPSIMAETKSKLVSFLVQCIFSENRKNFHPEFADEFPLISKQSPVIFHLFEFLTRNPALDISSENPILSKLVSNRIKNHPNMELVGSGQFGSVFLDKQKNHAIKLIKVPTSVSDRCTVVDVYNEILAMSACKRDAFSLELIDYGLFVDEHDSMNFFIESEAFTASLTKFRSFMRPDRPLHTVVLLIVFSEILAGVESLHKDARIIHYDLKMDNILVEFGGTTMEDAVENLTIPRIAIADFGEARVVEPEVTCVRNRGTECIKSPELLSMANKLKKDGQSFDRRKGVSTTYASDIWSLGCLFYEIITGQYLYRNVDGNWVEFYYRVTGEGDKTDVDVLPDYAIRDLKDERFVDFLRYLLVRDPDRRPSIDGTIKRFQKLYSSYIVDPLIFPSRTRIELPEAIPGKLRVATT